MSPQTQGQLNDFQLLMQRWATLGPYNAGHVMRVSGPPDMERWRSAITAALREMGVQAEQFSIAMSKLGLEEKVAEELNIPFAPQTCPLRAFIIDRGSDHLLGVIFDHWFADSSSMRMLMRRIFLRYREATRADALPAIRRNNGDLSNIFGAQTGSGFGALVACLRSYFRHRRAHRVKLSNALDFRADFFIRDFPAGSIDRLRDVARRSNATVNDLFLVAAAQVFGVHTAGARANSKRDRVGLAIAVDLRAFAPETVAETFGFCLSYFTVVLGSPEAREAQDLLRAVSVETSALKETAQPVRFVLGLRIARMVWDLFRSPRRKAQLFQKMLPILAGISNVNLTDSWIDRDENAAGGPRVIDYLRISPVGPLLPFVFTLTTIRNRLSMCVTYRATAFTRDEAEKIARDFSEHLLAIE